jgi:hypothetical protein
MRLSVWSCQQPEVTPVVPFKHKIQHYQLKQSFLNTPYYDDNFSSYKPKKSKFEAKSQILIFIQTYPDSLAIIIYEISGKKHQLDFELNTILHFNFENHFYL